LSLFVFAVSPINSRRPRLHIDHLRRLVSNDSSELTATIISLQATQPAATLLRLKSGVAPTSPAWKAASSEQQRSQIGAALFRAFRAPRRGRESKPEMK